jgi:hypothetical protein
MIAFPHDGRYPDDDWMFPDEDGVPVFQQEPLNMNRYILEDDDEVIELIANMMRAVNA